MGYFFVLKDYLIVYDIYGYGVSGCTSLSSILNSKIFNSTLGHVGFVGNTAGQGRIFLVLLCFPVNNHSTNASYSFIRLLPTPYNLSN